MVAVDSTKGLEGGKGLRKGGRMRGRAVGRRDFISSRLQWRARTREATIN